MSFKYEHLPNIYYWCGCFDHGDKDCDIRIQSKGTLQVSSQPYGAWLRAPPTVSTNNRVIQVSGYFENRKENISTRRRKAEKQQPIPVPKPVRETQVEKEIVDTGAEIMGALNLDDESLEPNKDEEQILRDPVTEGDNFEQQIRDIDKDLGFNENFNTPMLAVDSCRKNAMQAMMGVEEEIQNKQHMQPRDLS